jgi:hypothetical protein
MKYVTLVTTEKIKDQETGGAITGFEEFIFCEFNHGLGFVIDSKDALKNERPKEVQKTITDGIISTSQKLRNLNTF